MSQRKAASHVLAAKICEGLLVRRTCGVESRCLRLLGAVAAAAAQIARPLVGTGERASPGVCACVSSTSVAGRVSRDVLPALVPGPVCARAAVSAAVRLFWALLSRR